MLKVVLIGRGRLATNLERALLQAGHDVVSINSRTLEALPQEADVFIIAVKDDALTDVISKAAKGREGQLFVHTGGSMPLSLFTNHTRRYGVFYPMQTFSKERHVDFSDIPVFLEASDASSLSMLYMLAESISHSVYELNSDDRKFLHLAAVFGCNFSNHCYALAAQLLEQKGLPFSVMLPLIDETASKVHELHPLDAQTGPAVRYDEQVINKQHHLLDGQLQLQEVYDLLSQSIHRLAEEDHGITKPQNLLA
jgi:predicted short-subunit dehydrogenase-like oxidoreductase (DUF2520 family)